MKDSTRIMGGIVAFAAPVLLGWGYTAGHSLEDVLGGDDHEVDEWVIADSETGQTHKVDREEQDGVVTVVVTDVDGNVLQPDAYPGDIAERVAVLADPNWVPEDFGEDFGPMVNWDNIFDEGGACYHADVLADAVAADGGSHGVIMSSDDATFAVEVYQDGTVNKAYWPGNPGVDLVEHLQSGGQYLDLDGAQELNPC